MTRLLKITDLGSGIMVQGTNNVLYPDNATLTYPYNSIIVVTDESNIATFRSASNNDVLFSGLIGKIEIGGEIVTKENINTKFDAIANKESGGGGGSFADASYDSQTKRINFYDNGGNIVSFIDATGFIKDGMVSNVAISEGNLVITFNTDAGQEPISIALTDIFNSENYYNKTEVDGKLALKADASNVYTKEDADSKFLTEHQSLDNYYTKTPVNEALTLKQDANTAFSGDYNDLTNKPDLSVYAESADLATVATSGDYNDLTNKPTIPAAQVNADWDASSGVAQILNKPTNVSVFANDAGYLTEHQSLNNYYTKLEVDNQFTAIDKRMTDFDKGIDDLELIVSSSLNDLNARIEEISSDNTNQFTAINKRITDFDEGIDDLELIVSSSLNDLNTRIDKLTQRVTALENGPDAATFIVKA